jgi:hypothetical protein
MIKRRERAMTKFADMPSGSLNGWLAWCASHDWGAGPNAPAHYDAETGELVTYGGEFDGMRNFKIVEARHKTPAELKAWAGY